MLDNQRRLTVVFIAIGVLFALVNFYVFNQMNNGGLLFDLSQLLGRGSGAQAVGVLPDIKAGESYTKSKIRDGELDKIKNGLPHSNSRFEIVLNGTTKYLTVTIKADNLEQYRENKFLAEEKLSELGATEVCILHVVWNVPITLKTKVEDFDLISRGCSI